MCMSYVGMRVPNRFSKSSTAPGNLNHGRAASSKTHTASDDFQKSKLPAFLITERLRMRHGRKYGALVAIKDTEQAKKYLP